MKTLDQMILQIKSEDESPFEVYNRQINSQYFSASKEEARKMVKAVYQVQHMDRRLREYLLNLVKNFQGDM